MRVIWISVFLFLMVFGISVVLHEPAGNPQEQQPVPEATNAVDPFIEDEVTNKQVELAALPAEQEQESATSSSESPSHVDSTVAEQLPDQNAIAPSHQPDAQVSMLTLEKTATEDNASSVPVNEVDAPATEPPPQTKPLGLLARSIEQKKNQNRIAVIVHQQNAQELTISEIRAMYMDRITQWQDGSKIMLYNLPLGDRHREKFSKNILNMTALEADEAESQRREHNAAINSVRVKAKNIVVSYVERDPSAIAYVPLSMVREKSNVKVIATLP
jgi:hypothetical protein